MQKNTIIILVKIKKLAVSFGSPLYLLPLKCWGAINKEKGLLKSSKFTVIILTRFLSYAIIFLNDNVHKIESELSSRL